MLIGIAASLGAGAHEVLLHLVNEKGFLQLNLLGKPNSNHNINDHNALVAEEEEEESGNNNAAAAVVVRSPNEVLDFMTQQQRWLTSNYCIWPPLNTMHQVESLRRRPWFLLVSCDGPLLTRYHRFIKSSIFQAVPAVPAVPLDKFVEMDQKHRFGLVDHSAGSTSGGGLDEVMRSSDVHIVLNNDNPGQNHVKEALDSLDLTVSLSTPFILPIYICIYEYVVH